MYRPSFVAGLVLAATAAIGLSACGSSSTSSTPNPTATANAGGGGSDSGSSFCQQAKQVGSRLTSLSAGLVGTSPGATPSLDAYKQLFASTAQAIDGLDGNVPGQISSQFHQVRAAYDQAIQQIQSATSLESMSAALTSIGGASLQAANTAISNYFTSVCGISSGASTTAPSPT
ncbi:MAG: hypothetical protein M3R48_08060 [Candidatus Dormibacteraeota bacterium]|nr:hypothetical protein [Candidatus Dormibacteraeota bacterium]